MTLKTFASPHVHIQSLDTGSTAKKFLKRELELGSGVLTCTDHGTLAACRSVYDLARENKLTPILGIEAYLRDDDCPILAKVLPKRHYDPSNEKERALADRYPNGTFREGFKYGHLCLHALNQKAYEGIAYRLSLADARAEQHGSERKPLFNWADLEELAALGVTMTSGCLIGVVNRHLLDRDDLDTAVAYYERLRGIAGPGRFFVEVFPHDCSKKWVEGTFLKVEGQDKPLRFRQDKKLLVRKGEGETQEVVAEDLVGAKLEDVFLVGRMDRRKAVETEPARILSAESVKDFVDNELRDWCRGTPDVQAGVNRFALAMARKYGDPVLVSDDAHYSVPSEKILQEVRLAQSSGGLKFFGSYHRYSSQDAYEHFRATLGTSEREFEAWVDNSRGWADLFKDFKLEYKPSLPAKFYPADSLGHIQERIKAHGRMRWDRPEYVARLKREIDLLYWNPETKIGNGTLDWLPYFAMAEDACNVAAEARVLNGLGRGSAAGLLLAYLLEITHVDPLRRGLSLERFMTPDRIKSGKPPDIDLDFANRDVLIDPEKGWLWRKFGDHAIQISTVSTLHLSQACHDVARKLLGHLPPEVMALTVRFERPPQNVDDRKFVFGYTTEEGVEIAGSLTRDPALQEYVAKYPDHWSIVQEACGLPRQTGRHPCGFVVANRPIHEFIPVTSVSGVKVTQYSAAAVEACGGIKMDFLGVNSLADVQDCIALVQQRSGIEIPEAVQIDGVRVPGYRVVPHQGRLYDVWDLPEEEVVAAEIAAGRTETVFQFSTPGATHLLKHFNHKRPDGQPMVRSIYDLAVFTALDRPGGLDKEVTNPDAPGTTHNMLVEYARRARGLTPTPDIPKGMEELFPETHSIMIFQEQLQYAYQKLTGCSGPEAEEFRSNIAKKKVDKVQKAWDFFFPRASAKIGPENAKAAWSYFEAASRYNFNLSHAFCYAQTGYTCAWLKHYYPLEWWCGVLRNAINDDKNEVTGTFWKHCGKLVDLPDLTRSGMTFEIHDGRIVAPVQLLKGVGPKAHEEIVKYGPYSDIRDFVTKLHAGCVARGSYVQRAPTKTELKKNPDAPPRAVFKPGRSSVGAAMVSKLIAAGTMDRMFPADCLDLLSKIDHFIQVWTEVTSRKLSAKQRVELQGQYGNLTPMGRYLRRREVLSVYAEDLRELAVAVPGSQVVRRGEEYRRYGRPVVSVGELQYGEKLNPLPSDGIAAAAVGVLTEVKTFKMRANGRTLTRVSLDVEGGVVSGAIWPGEDGSPPTWAQGALLGAIVVVSLSRRKAKYGFSIDDMTVLERPIGTKDQEDSDE